MMKLRKLFCVLVLGAMLVTNAISVSAAETSQNDNTKVKVVDMNDVLDGEAIVYATAPTETKVLSKDYATSTGQTGTIYSIGQNVDFSSVIPDGATIASITIYCPTGTKVTQSKYTTISNYVITSYETNTSATVPFKLTSSPLSTSKTTAFEGGGSKCKISC